MSVNEGQPPKGRKPAVAGSRRKRKLESVANDDWSAPLRCVGCDKKWDTYEKQCTENADLQRQGMAPIYRRPPVHCDLSVDKACRPCRADKKKCEFKGEGIRAKKSRVDGDTVAKLVSTIIRYRLAHRY